MKEKVNNEWWEGAFDGYREWYEDIHRFCSVCASETDMLVEKIGFNTETGNQIYRVYKVCPKSRWWNSHDYDDNIPRPPLPSPFK